MFSSTIRFTKTSSPTPNTTPLLFRHSTDQVIVSISGDSIAVFNVHDVKRTATWPLHPKTILSSHPVIHQISNTIYAPIHSHQDLPSAATSKTIWAWSWDSVVRHRLELKMDHVIYAIFAPELLTKTLIVVHLNGEVSFVSHDLKSVTHTGSPLVHDEVFASKKRTIQYASDFVVDGSVYLVTVVAEEANLAMQDMVVCQITSESEIHVIRTMSVTRGSVPPKKIMFHAVSRHLTILYPNLIQTLIVPISVTEPKKGSWIKIPEHMGTPINCTALSTNYIACLHVLPNPLSSDKSRYAVSLYTKQFRTWQDTTCFDLDLVTEISQDEDVTSSIVVVNEDIIVALACAVTKQDQRSKAVLFRCTAQISHESLLSVIGRNRGWDKKPHSVGRVTAVLPGVADLSKWKVSIESARQIDNKAIQAIQAVKTSKELEMFIFPWIQSTSQSPRVTHISASVLHHTLTRIFSSSTLFSSSLLKWLCEHKYVSGSFTLSSANSQSNRFLRLVLDNHPHVTLLRHVLQHVRDIPEVDIVYMVHALCSAYIRNSHLHVFTSQMDMRSIVMILEECLVYPITDLYVHAALESYSASEGLVMIEALTSILNHGLIDVSVIAPMASCILDAHLTKILVLAATSDQTESIQQVFCELQDIVQGYNASMCVAEETLGCVASFLKSMSLMEVMSQQDSYIAMDGSMRTKGVITEKPKYVIEVLHF